MDPDVLKFFAQGISDNRLELLVHVRRSEDIEQLIAENNSLRAKNKKLEQDIYTWTTMGIQYQQALDDLRHCQRLLRKHGISY